MGKKCLQQFKSLQVFSIDYPYFTSQKKKFHDLKNNFSHQYLGNL